MTSATPLSLLLALFWALPSQAFARTWTVEADGSGDAATIQAAVDLAGTGDVIELGDGVFSGSGNRDVNAGSKALTFVSRSNNAEDCIIDCQGSAEENHRGFIIEQGCKFYGLTIRNAYASRGGAIYSIVSEGFAGIYDCVFMSNTAISGGGALSFEGTSRAVNQLEVRDSTFQHNHAAGGGAVDISYVSADFVDCQFIDNTAVVYGGAVSFVRSYIGFTKCLFVRNRASEGGAVNCSAGTAVMGYCTFARNQAHSAGGGAHISSSNWDGSVLLRQCILAFGAEGGSVSCNDEYGGGISPICCDIFGNEGGDWVQCLGDNLGQNANISSDPLFCDASDDDYTLSSNSPCAPANNSQCGLIGAFDVGCGPTATEPRSWGVIKSLYR